MMKRLLLTALLASGAAQLISGAAQADSIADTLFVYPAAGQSQQQLELDRYQCYRWAVDQSGVDPNQIQAPTRGPVIVANEKRGSTAKGTLIGTLAGALIGNAIDDHTYSTVNGAIVGATLGNVIGAENERAGYADAQRRADLEAQKMAQANNSYQSGKAAYNRAFTACMVGRSYSVR
ncbi:glycine zipper 2TM domain-containing protein [Halioxenophilus sp. WMMB6]|uniref:glycine zipper 2TM domain-containing protein n=1 Tax=Halioxenophilus sp. WMMB6 TaxID=3073815 RepID=UPI00295F2319|nr:glycine zipper 2TM domain-containing protein [Halioxenophilus sp. WMMB6]